MKLKLMSDEKKLVECRHHWTIFAIPLLFALISGFFLTLDSILELFFVIFLTLTIASYLWAIKHFFSYRYILTNKRLIIIENWFKRSTTDVYIDKIEGMNIRSLPLFSSVGTMIIHCSGGSKYHYKRIKKPQAMRDALADYNTPPI